jgi:hypothetical protein
VQEENVVKLIEKSQIRPFLLERARPDFEQVSHGDLALFAPVANSRKLHQALRTPSNEEKQVVGPVNRDGLDRRRVPQSQSLSGRVDQSIEVALDVVTIVLRKNSSEPPLKIVVDPRCDNIGVVAFSDYATEFAGQSEMSAISRIEVRDD